MSSTFEQWVILVAFSFMAKESHKETPHVATSECGTGWVSTTGNRHLWRHLLSNSTMQRILYTYWFVNVIFILLRVFFLLLGKKRKYCLAQHAKGHSVVFHHFGPFQIALIIQHEASCNIKVEGLLHTVIINQSLCTYCYENLSCRKLQKISDHDFGAKRIRIQMNLTHFLNSQKVVKITKLMVINSQINWKLIVNCHSRQSKPTISSAATHWALDFGSWWREVITEIPFNFRGSSLNWICGKKFPWKPKMSFGGRCFDYLSYLTVSSSSSYRGIWHLTACLFLCDKSCH